MKKGKKILKIISVVIIGLLVMGTVIMLLWNWLVPPIFHGPQITFWQALGLFVLAKIFFGGFRGGAWRRGGPHWRQRYIEKWSSMSPEQRELFKQRLSEKWCGPSRRKDESGAQTNV